MESLIQYLEMLTKKTLQNEISGYLVLTDFQVKREGHKWQANFHDSEQLTSREMSFLNSALANCSFQIFLLNGITDSSYNFLGKHLLKPSLTFQCNNNKRHHLLVLKLKKVLSAKSFYICNKLISHKGSRSSRRKK